ncbi:lithostathine-1-like [Oculina patagonica]
MKLIFALLFVVGLVEISLAGLTCPDNHWDLYGNSCYWFRPKVMASWHRARAYCQSKGWNLVKISSYGEQAFITRKINLIPYKSDRWTGLHSSSAGGSWADGSSLGSYKNWATGEPNYSGSNGACVAVKGKSDPVGKWYDDSCTSWKMYICEKPADVEVNECAADPSPCHINAVCSPTVGSYICKCKPGFTGDGKKTCAGNY